MGYYQGDFYGGARGDPGFFSFLGGIAKSAAGMMPGGGLATKAMSLVGRIGGSKIGTLARRGITLAAKHPVLTAAGGAGALGMGAAGAEHLRAVHGRLAKGAAGGMRRHKRMNVTNPRALRRAIRRTHGFARLAKKVLRFTEAHPKRGRMTFKPVKHAPRRRAK